MGSASLKYLTVCPTLKTLRYQKQITQKSFSVFYLCKVSLYIWTREQTQKNKPHVKIGVGDMALKS